jgi:ParB family chromosome partitioning protein
MALMTTPSAKRRTVSRAERPAELDELSARLSDRFETRVRVDQGRAKGKITIEFGSPEDLQRIVAQLVPSGERAELGGPSDFAELTEG